jgi:hypothetical protein
MSDALLALVLDLSLARREGSGYSVELRIDDVQASTERTPERGEVELDEARLRALLLTPAAYGRQLFRDLFGAPNVLRLYDEARAIAQRHDRPLRLRVFIHPGAESLHALRWETLHDGRPGGGWLLTDERLLFSRLLSGPGWQPAGGRPAGSTGALRALVAIASPTDLAAGAYEPGGQSLAPLDVRGEQARAQAGLGPLYREADVLASDSGQPGQVTLDRLRERLRDGYDVVYLACHGGLVPDGADAGPWLMLEQADGTAIPVPGAALIEQVRNLAPELRPRLVVLASCQSAGREVTADAAGALAALGPGLAQAGVPAVLAMQGSVSMETIARFAPTFFEELRQDGQVDRAMAVARSAVARRPDGWMPVLYLSLRDGRLWPPAAWAAGGGLAPGKPLQAPPPRANVVPRPAEAAALRGLLTADPVAGPDLGQGGPRVLAIHGLSGSGKSVLAAVVARDPAVLARFPDGVLWATLGEQPGVGELLSGWIQALGDRDFSFTLVEAAQRHLAGLLQEKAVLMILDDAWGPEHASAMIAGGPRCAVLITTREALVARAAGVAPGDLYELGVMEPDQSLAVLAGGPGRSLTPADRAPALRVAEAVGHLPLALELAAAQAADGVSWDELRADLEAETARLESLEDPAAQDVTDAALRKRFSLVASLNLSLGRLPEARRRQFAWFGVLPDDAPISPAMAATLWATDERSARDGLRYFRSKALLGVGAAQPGQPALDRAAEHAPERVERTGPYQLHDLLHDMARRLLTGDPQPFDPGELPGLGLALEDAQAQLLERYRRKTRDGLWHTLPDDGYVHAHLVWHLERAGRADEVHALLREETAGGENGWFGAREALGQSAGYVADVRGAWLATRPVPEADSRAGPSPADSLPLHLRYTVILASLHGLAHNIPAALIDRLVEAEIWGLPQALSYAAENPHPEQRARSLAMLAPRFPESTRGDLLRQALAAAQEYGDKQGLFTWLAPRLGEQGLVEEALGLAAAPGRDEDAVAATLVGLLPYLSPEQRQQALEQACDTVRESGDLFRAGTLAPLAPHLSGDQVDQLLANAQAMQSDQFRGWVVRELLPRLAELGRLDEAVTLADSIADPFTRAEVRAALLPALDEAARATALAEILDALHAHDDDDWRASLSAGIERVNSTLRDFLMVMFGEQSWRASLFESIGPWLPEPALDELLQLTIDAPDGILRALGLAALLPRLPDELRRARLAAALEAAREIPRAPWRARALAALAPHLPAPDRDAVETEVIAAVGATDGGLDQVGALVEVFPRLAEPARSRALELVGGIRDRDDRVGALARLAPELPHADLTKALGLAREIQDQDARTLTLAALAPGLAEPLLAEALAAAETLGEYPRARAIALLAPHLPGPLLDRALDLTQSIEYPTALAEVVLPALAPRFPEPTRTAILRRALDVVAAMHDGERSAWALEQLRDLLPDELLPDALEIASGVVDRVSDEFRSDALAHNLAALAPRLAEPLRSAVLREALDAARTIDDEMYRGRTLASIAAHLDEPLYQDALAIVDEMSSPYERAMAYGYLMEGASDDWRSKIVAAISELLPQFGATDFQDVQDQQEMVLARIVPWAMDPPAGLDFVVTHFQHEPRIRTALVALAPRLPADLLPRALDFARSIDDPGYRATALLALSEPAPEPLKLTVRAEALAASLAAGSYLLHNDALKAIVGALELFPSVALRPVWLTTVARLATLPRPDALGHLNYLAPLLLRVGGPETAQGTFRAIQDCGRWWR